MRITDLWRCPVKSTQGEPLEAAEVGGHGIVGDRQWALLDVETNEVLTARREPRLLFAQSRLGPGDRPSIVVDDGPELGDDAARSDWLGHRVALVRAEADRHGTYEIAVDFEDEPGSAWVAWDGPDGSFHDGGKAQLSVLSRAQIGDWDPRRFRANVLVDEGDEQDLLGATVELGQVVVRVAAPIGRCVMTTRPQPGGIERDLDVLRTINRERAGILAVGAQVLRPGRVQVGDELIVVG